MLTRIDVHIIQNTANGSTEAQSNLSQGSGKRTLRIIERKAHRQREVAERLGQAAVLIDDE